MSDDKSELAKELAEKAKNPNFKHVETVASKSEVALRLKCASCDHIEDFPVHCDQQMDFVAENNTLVCTKEGCEDVRPVPKHHDAFMKPFITGA